MQSYILSLFFNYFCSKQIVMRSFLNQFICLVSFIANAQEATSESNNIKLKEIREKQKEIQIQKTSDSLDVISKSQYGDPMIANSDAESMVQNQRATGTGIVTVSYTHLDVYKETGLIFCKKAISKLEGSSCECR